MDSRTPPHLAKQPNFFADTSPPPANESSAPATPLSSKRHRGPHRDGFSVKKCRDVLIRHCSWIPRNYNFKDGVNQVYEVLREYLGDENMDLAIAQLNELIEIPSDWLHEEGAPFQAWKHDYMLRHKDLGNSHVPRLRNIIVAPVNPTERLKKWREDHPDRDSAAMSSSSSLQTLSSSTEIQTLTPDFGIGTGVRGGDWRLENAIFVSSKAKGTRVLHCPSPQELHKKTWNDEFGRGGKLVQERIINPGDILDDIDPLPQNELPLKRKKSFADLRSMRPFGEISGIRRIRSRSFISVKLNSALHRNFTSRILGWRLDRTRAQNEALTRERCFPPHPLHGRKTNEVDAYEVDPVVRSLPDPESDIGRSYYSNIPTWPLPPCISIPSPKFARKHDLVPNEMSLPGNITIRLGPTADEMAIEKSFNVVSGSQSWSDSICSAGPFTPELFKDSGIDFPRLWGSTGYMSSCEEFEVGTLSDLGLLGDGAQSPSKYLQPVSECKQISSSHSTPPLPGTRFLLFPPNVVSRCSLEDCKTGSDSSSIEETKSSRLPQQIFVWGSSPKYNTSKTTLATVDQSEAEIVQTHSRTGLIKDTKQPCSESSCSERIATSTTILLQKEHYPSEVAMTDGIIRTPMETKYPIPSSILTVSRGYSSYADKQEANLQTESPLQNMISAIAALHPSEDCENHSMKTCRLATAFTSKGDELQDFKNTVLDTGDPIIRLPVITSSDSIAPDEFPGRSSTGKLTSKILQESNTLPLQSMLKSISLGSSRDQCVQNNNQNAKALNKHEINGIQYHVINSLELSSEIPLSLIQKAEELNKASLKYQADYKMVLNRDVHPPPLATTLQALQVYDPSDEHNFESTSERCLGFQRHLYYDPVRDCLKYRVIHYHPGNMRYYPEVFQYPPRTSSMAAPEALPIASAGTVKHRAMEWKPSPAAHIPSQDVSGSGRTSDSSNISGSSSGIMGNFIPVETVAPYAVTAASSVHNPQIDTNCALGMTEYKSNSHGLLGKIHYGVSANGLQEAPERNDTSTVKDSAQIKARQGIESYIESTGDRDSIDLNGPEALTKYIQYLKKNTYHTGIARQSDSTSLSLSQCLDGDAKEITDNQMKIDKDRKVVNSDEDVDIPRFTADDYHAIGVGNPFEFDPDGLQNDADRMTTFTDFMYGATANDASYPRKPREVAHLKNSHSEGNGLYLAKRPETANIDEYSPSPRVLRRSDSSPNISTMRMSACRDAAQNSLQSFYSEDHRLYPWSVDRGQHMNGLPECPTRGRGFSKPIAKELEAVSETGRKAFGTPSQSKKRSRSPIRKFFGEAWRSNPSPNDEMGTPKKPGLIEKTKNKIKTTIEEIGLKADIGLVKTPFRSDQELTSKQSTFPITLNPAQQAELYFDIEPLICVAANNFMMEEYRNCRMRVESFWKVNESWNSKGRPQVVGFHYDQSTQLDLIEANRETFRFHGRYTNNPQEIKTVICAWRSNAREMAIRTFCYSDSTIRRHIQHSFMILEFLGGHPLQFAALSEAQAKMVGWIEEAQVHMAARSSVASRVMNVWRCPNEFSDELFVDNPPYSSSKPTERPQEESNGSAHA